MDDKELLIDVEETEQAAHGNFMPAITHDTECNHVFWIKRCSVCRAIMESDSQYNTGPGDTLRIAYTDLDTLVCTPKLGKQLKEMKISQSSKLCWVEIDGTVTLRTTANQMIPKKAEVSAAFTSSELILKILRLPAYMHNSQTYEYMGKQAFDPNRMARLLIKLIQDNEQKNNH